MWGNGTSPLMVAVDLLYADAPTVIMWAPQQWARWKVLLPHVLAVVEHARPEADSNEVAWLLDRAGSYLKAQGRAAQGKELLEQALTINESIRGPDHPIVAVSLNNLATILVDLHDAEGARPLVERAVAIDESFYGPNHSHVAPDLNTLAYILRELDEPDTARPLAERAMAIAEAAHGPDHPDFGLYLGNLALILKDLGDLKAARQGVERALAICEAVYEPENPAIAVLLSNLSSGTWMTSKPLDHSPNAPWPSRKPSTTPTILMSPPA